MWLDRLRSTIEELSPANRKQEWQEVAGRAAKIVERAKGEIIEAVQSGRVSGEELEKLSKDPQQEELHRGLTGASEEEIARTYDGLSEAQILDLKRRTWVDALGVIREYNERKNRFF